MHRPYYVPSFRSNLNFPYEYKVPYPQYQTSPSYIAPTYDINRVPTGSVPSSYTYGKGRAKGTPRSDQGLNQEEYTSYEISERKAPGFYIINETNETVQVAISYRSKNCGGDGWKNVGWFVLAPGEERRVVKGYIGNYLYYYAETPDLTHTWPKKEDAKFPVWVEYGKFSDCEVYPGNLGVSSSSPPPGKRVYMREIYAPPTKAMTIHLTKAN
ncbi:DUF1036 domain-containing protein [Neobacillus niacini]|uniref:DUF1036 domain-containing protein n=1 Tax=Neobacillus niacini TaxID=86668 RepID=UPI0005EF7D9C|nr:DUF1036 domain-containing protein [Neobacillus niacini]